MKFIVDVSFPLGPFNTLCPLGHGREKVGDRHFPVEPELVYFIDNGVGRGAAIVDPDRAGRAPQLIESFDAPLRRAFGTGHLPPPPAKIRSER